jgi:type VI protein secretion system component VasK
MKIFEWIGKGFKGLGRLFLPMLSKAPAGAKRRPVLQWILRLLILSLILVGLWFLNSFLGIDRYVRAPRNFLRQLWLPLLFLLFYILCWLGWSLWKLVGPDQLTSSFPDIDQAWDEAVVALAQAGIELNEAPLFLILGHPRGGEKSLFGAAGQQLLVKQVPRETQCPISVSASQDAIYVSCTGASLLGQQSIFLSIGPERVATTEERPAGAAEPTEGTDGAGTLLDGGMASPVAAQSPQEEMATALVTSDASLSMTAEMARVSILKDAAEVERTLARLQHLCKRIARSRRPYCPINGMLALIPLSATSNNVDAKDTATLIRRDLDKVKESLQVECPVFAIVCDFERADGFEDFVAFFPEGQRRRFLGQKFPLVPDLDESSWVKMVESGVQWVGNNLFPSLVYGNWAPEDTKITASRDETSANVRLYRFLWQMRERQRRLARILTRGILIQEGGGSPMFGGFCFASTGRDLMRDQGFANRIFRLMHENQNHVIWTREALAVESAYRRWTYLGYLALGFITILAIGLLLSLMWWRS